MDKIKYQININSSSTAVPRVLPPKLGGQNVGHKGNLQRGGHDVEEQRGEDEVDGAVFGGLRML